MSAGYRMPIDVDAERAMLAELAVPLHGRWLEELVAPEDFADPRHWRIAVALANDTPLRDEERVYVEELDRFAFPITAGLLARFTDAARRRRRLAELEAERIELLAETWRDD